MRMTLLAGLAALAMPAALGAQRMIGGDQPVLFPAQVSPDGSWEAWLQHTGGPIQPIYYSVVVHRRDDGGARPCVVATATGPYLERRMRLSWEGPNRLVVHHSLNGDQAGTFNGIRHGCGDIFVKIDSWHR